MPAQEITQAVLDANTVTTIINNIDSLYSNALTQLSAYTLGVLALVGVIIPILITIIQARNLKSEKESLIVHINNEIRNAQISLSEEFDKRELALTNALNSKINSLVKEVEVALQNRVDEKLVIFEAKIECADASTFQIQGNDHLSKNKFVDAAEDYCNATEGYLKGKDELNGQRTLAALITVLPKINKQQYEDNELAKYFEAVIETLKELNQNSKYSDQIDTLNKGIRAIKLREPT